MKVLSFFALLCVAGYAQYALADESPRDAPVPAPAWRVAVLREALPGTTPAAVDALADLLRDNGCTISALSAADACRVGGLGTNRFDAYFIPNASVYPAAGFSELGRFIEGGGNLIVLGGPAFSRPVWQVEGAWLDVEGIDALVAQTRTTAAIIDMSDPEVLAGWRRASNEKNVAGSLKRVTGGADSDGWCIEYATENLSGWDTWSSPQRERLFPPGHDLLCFYARWEEGPGQIAIELGERDGSRWITVIDVGDGWSRSTLHPGRFRYWADASTQGKRGGVGDAVVPANVVRLSIGLANTHTKTVAPGAHRFWIDAVGTASNALAAVAQQVPSLPVIETVNPAYKVFAFNNPDRLEDREGTGTPIVNAPPHLVACAPRPRGLTTGGATRSFSWYPLVMATRSGDEGRGCVAWALQDGRTQHAGRVVAVGAGEQTVLLNRPLRDALLQGVRGMRDGHLSGGEGQAFVEVGAGEHDAPVPPAAPSAGGFITARDGDFWCGDRKWYPVGVNFWPSCVAGMERDDYFTHWLNPKWYDGSAVENDLRRAAGLGINMVAIQSLGMGETPSLLDFLARCARYEIKVYLFTVWTSPLGFNADELRRFVEAGNLASNPAIFAYDLIWEPGNHLFHANQRGKWDAAWRNWIVERYGSIENAEADWGIPVPRRKGQVSHPDDPQLREDGEWRVMVAAYRRFMDDVTSRKWNDAVRQLRAIDPNHLVSFRQGNTLPHDFAFTGPVKHIDFVCPEGYAIRHSEDGFLSACFTTRFVDFTTGGKPIVWMEFGKSIWDGVRQEPDRTRFDEQAAYHDLFYRMSLETGADGTCPWWWPGGYRVDERSDFGIVNQDGTYRPSAKLIPRYAGALKTPRAWPEATEWFTYDRDAHPGGYWHVVFNSGKDAYAAARKRGEMLGVRTEASGTTSVTCPLKAVGNRPCTGNNPPKYLNAEFNWVRVKVGDRWSEVQDDSSVSLPRGSRAHMKVSVGNLQEATWVMPSETADRSGGVSLASRNGSDVAVRVAVPRRVGRFEDVEFEDVELTSNLDRPLRLVLQMNAENRTRFGEVFEFRLVPGTRHPATHP